MSHDIQYFSFGVEIEFTRLKRSEVAQIMAEHFATSFVMHGNWEHDTYDLNDSSGRRWRIVGDRSIFPEVLSEGSIVEAWDEYQCEVVSPVLFYKDIPVLCDLLAELKNKGAGVNNTTGIHIHIGGERFTAVNLRVLCNLVYAKQFLLLQSVGTEENRKQQYSQYLNAEFIQHLNKVKPKTMEDLADLWYGGPHEWFNDRTNHYHKSRYQLLNLHNLLSGRLQTIEFRMFNGTLDGQVIKSYIQLCLLITAQALNQQKATARITVPSTGNEKYTVRVWLLKMGAIGDEFRALRLLLLKPLKGNSAWRDPQLQSRKAWEAEVQSYLQNDYGKYSNAF